MRRNRRIGLGVLLAGAVALASIGTARSADAADTCCFTNEGYSGMCHVARKQDESCAGILAYLNNPTSSGKDYCDTTAARGGWQQVNCGDKRSGPTSSVSIPSSASALADKGVGAVLVKDAETFTSATGGTVEYHLKAGTIFGFFTRTGGWGEGKGTNGFYGVAFFPDNSGGDEKTTWVNEESLASFYWECTARKTAGGLTSRQVCIPANEITRMWKLKFKKAASEKCKQLGIQAFEGSAFAESIAPPHVEPPAMPTAPVGPSDMPDTQLGPSAAPSIPLGPSAVPTTPLGPSAVATTPLGPSAVPTTPEEPPPTPTAPAKRSSP